MLFSTSQTIATAGKQVTTYGYYGNGALTEKTESKI